jgi:DNA polymerase-4
MTFSPWRKPPDPLYAAVALPHFPAQALSAAEPKLRGAPFAVVEQHPDSHKTRILALSSAAQTVGLQAGMPVFAALRQIPRLRLLPRDRDLETELREQIEATLLRHTPMFSVQPNGSACIDMTGTPESRRLRPEQWSALIHADLLGLGLDTVALGAGSSQVVAQVLARLARGDGAQVCPAGKEARLLAPLSPALLPGLSPHCRDLLRKYGLLSVAQLRRLGKEEICLRFGKEGEKLYSLAQGLDLEALQNKKTILYAETVMDMDLNDGEALQRKVRLTADRLGHALRLRDERAVKLRMILTYSDQRVVSKTVPVKPPTFAFKPLAEIGEHLLEELYERRVALRRIRLEAPKTEAESGQLNLFDSSWTHKQEALGEAILRIRRKRSFEDVLSGSNVGL